MSNRRKINLGKLARASARNLAEYAETHTPAGRAEAVPGQIGPGYHHVTLSTGEQAWCSCPADDDHSDR